MNAMTQCPVDSDLMKAWNAHKQSEDHKNSFYWATTELRMRQERADEHGVPPEANRITPEMRERNVEGSLWAAFLAGFGAAGGKVTF